jgi:Protein of unknown function (DUF2752).
MGIKKWSIILVWGIFAVLYCLPEDIIFGENRMFGFCLHKLFLGFDCPGCGMTRAIYSFLHLEFLRAIKFNISIIVFIPLILLYTLNSFEFLQRSQFKLDLVYFSFIALLFIVYFKKMMVYIML